MARDNTLISSSDTAMAANPNPELRKKRKKENDDNNDENGKNNENNVKKNGKSEKPRASLPPILGIEVVSSAAIVPCRFGCVCELLSK